MSLDRWLAQQRRDRSAEGLTRELHPRSAQPALVDLAGNDYLGLATDPRVTEAAATSARLWGAGAGASRLVTGSLEIHADLETALARFTGRPAALVLSSGYHANLATVTALCDPDTLIVSDAHVHASLIDACRLARHGGLAVSAHNDVGAISEALADRSQRRALVLVESVYSVLGDAAPLAQLVDVARRYGATLVVDEAHAIGVAGPGGRGLVYQHGLQREPFVVTTMTLSKSLGSQGGAVLGTPAVVDQLVNAARPFIYDTGLAPAAAGAALAAMGVIESAPGLPARSVEIARRMAEALGIEAPAGAVLSIAMPGPGEALQAQADFARAGFQVGCFRPPSTPDGGSRLRLTARACLTDPQVDAAIELLSRAALLR
jgi:8-amino-7-oxononanoate synthase